MIKKGKDLKSNAIRIAKAILKEIPDLDECVSIQVSKALMDEMNGNLKVAREYMKNINIYLRAHGHKDEDDNTYWYLKLRDYWQSDEDPSEFVFALEDEYMSSY